MPEAFIENVHFEKKGVNNQVTIMHAPSRQRENMNHMSRGMRFLTMWYVRLVKAQTSLRIRAV